MLAFVRRMFSGKPAPPAWTFEQVLKHSKLNSSELASSKTQLIDVREPGELASEGTIPNAINIPLGQLKSKLPSVPVADKSDLMVFTCKSGMRAQSAAEIAESCGYPNVAVYHGSFTDWRKRHGN